MGKPAFTGPTTQIRFCTCVNEFQDKKYGIRQRVHNRAGGKGTVKWRCTVCGNEKGS
jgi:hypothetical protein